MLPDRVTLQKLFVEDYFGASLTEAPSVDALAASAVSAVSCNVSPELAHWVLGLRQVEAFVSKRVDPSVPHDLNRASLWSFAMSQSTMQSLNRDCPWRSTRWFATAQFETYRILGDGFLDWQELCVFGKGASTLKGGTVGRHITTKVGGVQSSTDACVKLFVETVRDYYPAWMTMLSEVGVSLERTNRSRLAFVPKTAKAVRMIAIEPTCNMFLQQGLGRYLMRRLRIFGVNLFDQTKNQDLARLGSIDGSIATIDLSAASDRIPKQLVWDLLPPVWRELFFSVRTTGVSYGQIHLDVETYATMGNATTFPIESLVFNVVLKSAGVRVKSVYGDDIIVDSRDASRAIEVLQSIGSTVNESKTFINGNFKESCGADYFGGINVRPVFYKADAASDADLACLHNLLYWRYGDLPLTLSYLRSCAKRLICGPAMVYKTDDANVLANVASPVFRSWFWSLGSACPKKKYVTLALKPRHRVAPLVRFRTFLYAGSRALMSSSICKVITGRNRLTAACSGLPLSHQFDTGEGRLSAPTTRLPRDHDPVVS